MISLFKKYFNKFMMCLFILSLLYYIILMNFIFKIDLKKLSAYKCGFQSFFETSYPFEVQFVVIAIMFLLFCIEVLYPFPLISSLYTLLVDFVTVNKIVSLKKNIVNKYTLSKEKNYINYISKNKKMINLTGSMQIFCLSKFTKINDNEGTIVVSSKQLMSIQKRFYPGSNQPPFNGLKKLVEKCIGDGCKDVPVSTSTWNAVHRITPKSTMNTTAPKDVVNTQNSLRENNNIQKKPTTEQDNLKKTFEKPLKSITERYNPNHENNFSATSTDNNKKELTNAEKINLWEKGLEKEKTDTVSNTSQNTDFTSGTVTTPSVGSFMAADDNVDLPSAPLIPLVNPHINHSASPQSPQLPLVPERVSDEINKKLKALEERTLFTYQNNEEKLTAKFFELQAKEILKKVEIFLDNTQKFTFDIGLLQITDIDNTVLITGLQNHVVVVYVIQENKKVVVGYLTSSKNADVILSAKQPFDYYNENSNKAQRFTTLKKPLIIECKEHLKPLEQCTLNDGRVVNQQQIGHEYINNIEIKKKIQNQIETKVIPQIQKDNGLISVYEGKGITEKDIDTVLIKHAKIAEQNSSEILQQFIKIRNEQNDAKKLKFLENNKKKLDKITFELLLKKIENYEKLHK
jgi:NADH:ubiquinone oxidoreductase subunit 3 (subunit A)